MEGTAGDYAERCASQPEGTFTPARYMAGLGAQLQAPPIWIINVMSLSDEEMVAHIDTLKDTGVPVHKLELGNEKANGSAPLRMVPT